MFQINENEWNFFKNQLLNLKSQNAISNWCGRRSLPYVFTEQGVAGLFYQKF